MDDILIKNLRNAFDIESDCLDQGADKIDKNQFIEAIEILASAEKIAASGCGHSGIACRHFVHLMCCIEKPARFIAPSDAVHGATGYLKQGDAMMFVSRGGKTSELLPILEICREKGVKVLLITENESSPLAISSDVILKQYITRETDKFNSQGTTSFTTACVIFHALQAALIEKTDFKLEKFAKIHPGGAVGERLNRSLTE